jgi:hypothetical protein
MATMDEANGPGKPLAAEIVKDALEQYPDLPDHVIIRVGGPEDYILQRLNEAGLAVVRTSDLGTTAWQFNEAVSMLREARGSCAPGIGEDIDDGLPAIQDALTGIVHTHAHAAAGTTAVQS